MSAQWYYMSHGWFHTTKRIGPISEPEMLLRIDRGKISPETLVQSTKTRQRWVPMSTIEPAMRRWKASHPNEAGDAAHGQAS